MITIKEIFENFEKIGCLTFSTIDDGHIESRIAHFFAYDNGGLYFRTMNTKPFYKQLKENKILSVSGMYPTTQLTHDENNLPHFQPGFTLRISGDVRELSIEEVKEKAKNDINFTVAVFDIEKYPATKIFVLDKAKGELFDFDFEKTKRDHKLYRERFSIGGMEYESPGLMITEKCIECGKCKSVCTFDAIVEGSPYKIDGSRCDECGNCYTNCPVNAIMGKGGI